MRRFAACVGLALLIVSPAAAAQDWFYPDAESRGIGNAGVAAARGPLASYWNPAALALEQDGEFSLSAGGTAFAGSAFLDVSIEGDIMAQVDEIFDLFDGTNFPTAQGSLNAGSGTDAELQAALRILAEIPDLNDIGVGVVVQAGATVEGRYGPIGFFTRYLGHAAIDPRGLLNSISLADGVAGGSDGLTEALTSVTGGSPTPGTNAATLESELLSAGVPAGQAATLAFHAESSIGNAGLTPQVRAALVSAAVASMGTFGDPAATVQFNDSGVRVSGIVMKEAGVSFAYPLGPTFRVGVALKEIIGETFEVDLGVDDLHEVEVMIDDIRDRFDENRLRTNKFNVDVGVSWSPLPLVTLGVTAKNLIPQEYPFRSGGSFELEPQVRAGASIELGVARIAADFDLNDNLTDSLAEYKSRVVALGVRLTPALPGIGFTIGAGAFRNVESEEADPVYSLSLGFGAGPFLLSLNGQLSAEKVDVESSSALNGTDDLRLPERLAFAATVGLDLAW